jgi:S-adenosylmethionine:tRNA ribosyltransferase-isomerase
VVDALLTGMHDPTESHGALLQAFAPRTPLERAQGARGLGLPVGHEFGDDGWIG